VTGHWPVACVVARSEGQLDETVFNRAHVLRADADVVGAPEAGREAVAAPSSQSTN